MKITMYAGAPNDLTGRTEAEVAVYKHLESIGMNFETYWHDTAYTMEECAAVEAELNVPICKNLFLCNRQQTDFYLLMIPADKIFKTKYLSSQLGCARLSFASAETMIELLQIQPGAMSPMGLLHDRGHKVRLIIDKDVLEYERFGCHPCVNIASLVLKMSEFLNKYLPSVGHDFTPVELIGE